MTRLATWTAGNSADRAAIAFLLDALGIAERPLSEPADAGAGPLLAHGPLESGAGRVVIPRRPEDAGALATDLVHRLEVDSGPDAVLPVDVVSVIGALLRDQADGDLGREGRDEHGRVRYASSTAARTDADGPLVDRIVERTGWWLHRRLGIVGADRWPDGARFAVGLSHDVDHPDRYPTVRALMHGPQRLGRAPRTLAVRATDDLTSLLAGSPSGRVLGVRPARGKRGEPRVRGDLVLRLDPVPRPLGDHLRRRLRHRGHALPTGLRPIGRGGSRGRPAHGVRGICRARAHRRGA